MPRSTDSKGLKIEFLESREDQKSKCPIWCRLQEFRSHFSFSSCTILHPNQPSDISPSHTVGKGGAESSEGRIVLTGKSSDRFLFPTEKRLSLHVSSSLRTSGCRWPFADHHG